jgi:hypothetical protein
VDRVHTAEIDSHPVAEFGVGDLSGGMLRIGNAPFDTAGPNNHPTSLRLELNERGQLRAESGGQSITLGQRADLPGTIRPGVGERARFRIERSLLSWPTPLEINFMSGASPSWKRHLYYRLNWEKQSGERLEMVWRYEQWFYSGNGWASGFMTRAGTTGLIHTEIAP